MKLDIQRFAILMKETKSTVGSPYAYYTVESVHVSNRQLNSVDVTVKVHSHLQYSGSSLGSGSSMGLVAKFNFNGGPDKVLTLKETNKSWSGTTVHTAQATFTIEGLTPNQTSLSVAFRVSRTGSASEDYKKYGCALSKRNISSVSIPNSVTAATINGVNGGELNFTPNISFIPCAANLKFRIKYSYSSWSHTTDLISPNTTTLYVYSGYTLTATELAPYLKYVNGNYFTITLYTYLEDGVTLLGSDSKEINVSLDSTYVPTASVTTPVEASSEVPASWGVFVQNKSRASFHITGVPSYGSTITNYYTQEPFDNENYYTQDVITNILKNSKTYVVSVKDSRGVISEGVQINIALVPYEPVSIVKAEATRCDAQGNINNQGDHIIFSFKANYSDCANHNTVTCEFGYKLKSGTAYKYIVIPNDVTNMVLTDEVFNINNAYDIQFRATDTFGSDTESISISSGFVFLHFNKNKKALAIGQYSSATNNALFEVAVPTTLNNVLKVNSTIEANGNITANNGNLQSNKNGKNFYIDASDHTNDTCYRTDSKRHWFDKNITVNGNINAENGSLISIKNGRTATIGSKDANWCWFETTAPRNLFTKPISVMGDVYGGAQNNRRLAYIDEIHPVGSCYITSTNTNPNNQGMPGTWTLIDKVFESKTSTNGNFGIDGGQTTNATAWWSRAGHTLNLELGFTNKVKIDDATHHIGKWNLGALGVSRLPHVSRYTGYTDGGNCCLMMDCATTGDVNTYDIIPDAYISAGKWNVMSMAITIPMDMMLDNACNQFIWKRTA